MDYSLNPLLKNKRNSKLMRCFIIFICFTLFLSVFSFFVPNLSAEADHATLVAAIQAVAPNWDESQPVPVLEMYNSLDSFSQGVFNWVEAIYGGGIYDDIFSKYLSLRLPDENTTASEKSTNYFMNAVNTISGILVLVSSLGVGLLCIWFFVDIIGKATSDSFTPEHFVKSCTKFVAGYLVVSNLIKVDASTGAYTGLVPIIINGTADIVQQFSSVNNFSGGAVSIDSPLVQTWYELYNGNFFTAIGVWVDVLLPSLLSTLAGVIIRAFSLGRIIELALLVVFSPIAVSNLFGDASHDQNYGIKYLKKLAAVELQGLLMYYIIVLGTNMQGAMNGANLIGAVAVVCVEAALIARSRNIATEIFGVH